LVVSPCQRTTWLLLGARIIADRSRGFVTRQDVDRPGFVALPGRLVARGYLILDRKDPLEP